MSAASTRHCLPHPLRQPPRRQHHQRQHGRLAISNRTHEHTVQQREVHRRQPGQHVRPAAPRKSPHARQPQCQQRHIRAHDRQPRGPRAQRRLVGPHVPRAQKLDPSQLQRPSRIGPGPGNRLRPHPPVQPHLERVALVAVFRRTLRGRELRHESHVAAAVGRGTQSVVQTGAHLQRRRHELPGDQRIANPPRSQACRQAHRHRRADEQLPPPLSVEYQRDAPARTAETTANSDESTWQSPPATPPPAASARLRGSSLGARHASPHSARCASMNGQNGASLSTNAPIATAPGYSAAIQPAMQPGAASNSSRPHQPTTATAAVPSTALGARAPDHRRIVAADRQRFPPAAADNRACAARAHRRSRYSIWLAAAQSRVPVANRSRCRRRRIACPAAGATPTRRLPPGARAGPLPGSESRRRDGL